MNKFIKNGSIIAIISAFALTGCTSGQSISSVTDPIIVKVNNNLPALCSAIDVLDGAFAGIAATGSLNDKIILDEKTAFDGVSVVCAQAEAGISTTNALSIIVAAYAKIKADLASTTAVTSPAVTSQTKLTLKRAELVKHHSQ